MRPASATRRRRLFALAAGVVLLFGALAWAAAVTKYNVSVSASPAAGGTVKGGGNVAAGATRTVSATAKAGYSFANWTENGGVVSSSPSFSFTVTQTRALVANFAPRIYTINLSAAPGGAVTGSASTAPYNSVVTFTAIPGQGYTFYRWTDNGKAAGTTATLRFTVKADRNLVANFKPANYRIAVTASPANRGKAAGAGNFAYNSARTVTATPKAGSIFAGWLENGVLVSLSPSYTFTVGGARNLVASFVAAGTPVPDSLHGASTTTTNSPGAANIGTGGVITQPPNINTEPNVRFDPDVIASNFGTLEWQSVLVRTLNGAADIGNRTKTGPAILRGATILPAVGGNDSVLALVFDGNTSAGPLPADEIPVDQMVMYARMPGVKWTGTGMLPLQLTEGGRIYLTRDASVPNGPVTGFGITLRGMSLTNLPGNVAVRDTLLYSSLSTMELFKDGLRFGNDSYTAENWFRVWPVSDTTSNGSDSSTGAGSITKTGDGTLTLAGANSYLGNTTVNGGTLTINGSNVINFGGGNTTGALSSWAQQDLAAAAAWISTIPDVTTRTQTIEEISRLLSQSQSSGNLVWDTTLISPSRRQLVGIGNLTIETARADARAIIEAAHLDTAVEARLVASLNYAAFVYNVGAAQIYGSASRRGGSGASGPANILSGLADAAKAGNARVTVDAPTSDATMVRVTQTVSGIPEDAILILIIPPAN